MLHSGERARLIDIDGASVGAIVAVLEKATHWEEADDSGV
jgi:hypothetical protein